MLHTVAAAYRDTCASDLSLRLGLAPQPALSTLSVALAGSEVELRLLGHSHQVLTRVGPKGRGVIACPERAGGDVVSEVVACLPDRGELPATAHHALPEADYHFQSHVVALAPPALATRALRLLAGFSEHPRALVGAFPGSPHALTVVLAQVRDSELTWRSWHLYPQSGQVVLTRSRVRSR